MNKKEKLIRKRMVKAIKCRYEKLKDGVIEYKTFNFKFERE